jgi:hypothetical protein
MIGKRKQVLKKKPVQCGSVYHISHMDFPGFERICNENPSAKDINYYMA